LKNLLPAIGGGLLLFAAGAALALAILPEWRAGDVPNADLFEASYREIAGRAGFQPVGGEPKVTLVARRTPAADAYRFLGERGADWLATERTALQVKVDHSEEEGDRRLEVDFSLSGRPRHIEWMDLGSSFFRPVEGTDIAVLARTLAPLLLAPGESLGGRRELSGPSNVLDDVVPSSPAQSLSTSTNLAMVSVERRLGSSRDPGESMGRSLVVASLRFLPVGLAVAGLFLTLLLRARIDLVNGAALALAGLLSARPAWLFELPGHPYLALVQLLLSAPGLAIWVFLVWSAGESLLRATHPDFTTSLDSLRLGRLGPRGGRALLLGFAAGAALAGLRLALYAVAVAAPGLSPAGPSLTVPVFRLDGSPLADGIALAGGVALAYALAVRFLPNRWVLPAAALLAGYALEPLALIPFSVELAVNAVFAGAFVWVCHRFGLTALLAAAVVSLLLPAALFSGLHLDWMAGSFAVTTGLSLGIVLLGSAGLRRSLEIESEALPAPAFIRRLRDERRLRHELDLLGRMQLGLLPQEMPRVEGWEVAARSVLAGEAGGDLYDFLSDDAGNLWIAAGDVAGHGFSCAIAQAMIKAGLVSLAAPHESPAEVLGQLDRMLRGVELEHSFTSLALLRLDPKSGDALFANAGHPFPLLFAGGTVAEIEIPGLPLGQGPGRTYRDHRLHLPPGSALALCSDGLSDVPDRNGDVYGFDRAREVFQVMGHRPALEIVDALQNDCRRHLGNGELPDDVTVVVIKRA
jgi:hypothetical protein